MNQERNTFAKPTARQLAAIKRRMSNRSIDISMARKRLDAWYGSSGFKHMSPARYIEWRSNKLKQFSDKNSKT